MRSPMLQLQDKLWVNASAVKKVWMQIPDSGGKDSRLHVSLGPDDWHVVDQKYEPQVRWHFGIK